ncbi:uncharacterized protein LY89DRAFT_789960 [Mollisia scopiformis]|uniref:Uncharacterized protein n=1 Tax=Mollisia scopiformis TaxID=149040 RepID=A0A132B5B0_MOLSC|nr:uncharacterized protein LY89DRAFT_789960 [Mollisia scopiformis]KUJ07169.1 hypothetical protein LY89DRAFT_789960 [Mollisia scopiformis]
MSSKKKQSISRKTSTPKPRASHLLAKKQQIASNKAPFPPTRASIKSKKVKSRKTVLKTMPLAFSRFPPEIRENIFSRCIDTDAEYQPRHADLILDPLYATTHGIITDEEDLLSLSTNENDARRSPNLIIALRGHPTFYAEAIRCFYRLNTFFISQKSLKTWKRMKGVQEILGMMRHIAIVSELHTQVKYRILPTLFTASTNNVRSIDLNVHSLDGFVNVLSTVFTGFLRLKYIGVWIRSVLADVVYDGPQKYEKLHAAMTEVNKKLGIKKWMSRVNIGDFEHWFWEDEKGRTVV